MMQLSLSGVKELDDMLRGLPSQVQHSVLLSIHKEAAKPLVAAAQSLAPVKHGLLKKAIGTASGGSIKRTGEIGLVTVGPRRKGGYAGFHGHLVEKGTKRRTTKSGANRGVMPAMPFMEPAFNATQADVVKRIQIMFGDVLWKYMKRTLKKAGKTIV